MYSISNLKIVVIIAPFYFNQHHVGIYRIERYIKFFKTLNYKCVLLSVGNTDEVIKKDDITIISVRDYISYLLNFIEKTHNVFIRKTFNYLIDKISNVFFIPDRLTMWNKRILSLKWIDKYIQDACLVLSSSPPESSHLIASALKNKYNFKQIVDMRDGWLDEPLNSSISPGTTRYAREMKLENDILQIADHIFVTSEEWKTLLLKRKPILENKASVLTNAYPVLDKKATQNSGGNNKEKFEIEISYAGKFSGSSYRRKPSVMLNPLYSSLKKMHVNLTFNIWGDLHGSDFRDIDEWKKKFKVFNCNINVNPAIARDKLFTQLSISDGLVLLSVSHAAIPSKFFEYLALEKPILAFAPNKSAVWNIGKEVTQVFLVDIDHYDEMKLFKTISNYIEFCKKNNQDIQRPERFSEEYLSNIFIQVINSLIAI